MKEKYDMKNAVIRARVTMNITNKFNKQTNVCIYL